MSGKSIRETVGFLGVILSLAFVGQEIRQSNIQARASAYQAIGIATAEFYSGHAADESASLIYYESFDAEKLQEWGRGEWARFGKIGLATLRLVETVQLQVDQGLLDPDAMDRLGYAGVDQYLRIWPGLACLWTSHRAFVGQALIDQIESTPASQRFDCARIDPALLTFFPSSGAQDP